LHLLGLAIAYIQAVAFWRCTQARGLELKSYQILLGSLGVCELLALLSLHQIFGDNLAKFPHLFV
jgi:hypothetical protein